MRKYIKIGLCFTKMNLASALEYRASFLTQLFGMALSNSAFLFFWWLTFSKTGESVAGYHFEDVVFIWAVASTGVGIGHIFFDNVSSLSRLIITGELDTCLIQPCNLLINILCSRTSLAAYGDLAYGIMLMILFYCNDARAWGWYIVGSLLSTVVLTGATLFAHTLTFYCGDATLIGNFMTEFIVNFSVYPEKIYGKFIRWLMYTVIPAGIGVHVPLKMYHSFELETVVRSIVWVIIYCGIVVTFFFKGLQKYESGNVISIRL